MEELHWYNISFTYRNGDGCGWANSYKGVLDKEITLSDINNAKDFAGLPKDSIVVSVSYLGKMTKEKLESA